MRQADRTANGCAACCRTSKNGRSWADSSPEVGSIEFSCFTDQEEKLTAARLASWSRKAPCPTYGPAGGRISNEPDRSRFGRSSSPSVRVVSQGLKNCRQFRQHDVRSSFAPNSMARSHGGSSWPRSRFSAPGPGWPACPRGARDEP